ncbi:MAG: tetratricopeptide repeat protein [Proteobacteria bacterium]|nr:tetratricopeptide repeat protein [Pseudomonadota bacterium]
MAGLITELKRRNVFRVAAAYGVVGWLLAEVGGFLFQTFEAPAWVLKVFATLIILGFPLALFLSWAFEITPEGIKREHEIDRSGSITHQTGQRLNTIIIVAIAIAVAILLFDRFGGQQSAQLAESESAAKKAQDEAVSIAVLPFVNMSSDPEQEYFSVGISEEILNQLVRVEGLSVASRTSAFAFKGQDLGLDEIARELGVDYVLEGSVRKDRDNIRITAQLIDASTDRHLWSETYDRELTSIFAIQDEISGSIVEALRETLGVDIQKASSTVAPTSNMDAYEAFLKARELFLSREPLALRQSLEIYQQAIDRDPGFARAYEGLAAVYAVIPSYTPEGYEQIGFPEAAEKAIPAARKALELDATLAMPHAVLGMVSARFYDHEIALKELDTAIKLDRRESTFWMWRGMRMAQLGYLEEALKYYREAYRLAPDVGINSDHFGSTLLNLGRFEEAYPYLSKSIDSGRKTYSILFFHNLHNGDFLNARLGAMRRFGGHEMLQYLMPIFEGQHEASERQELINRFWEKLKLLRPDDRQTYNSPLFTGAMGDFDRATEIFYQNPGWRTRIWNPALAEYRSSAQFKGYVRQTRMEAYWRKHGWPDFCRPLGDDDFECD